MNRLLSAVALIAPALAAILLYAPSLKFGFVWDDRPLVVENPEVAGANPLPLFARSFTHSWSERGLGPHAYYRPLVTMSFWLDHRLWRLNPAGYHLTNVILNALCAGLVAALAAVLLKSAWPALFAGLLFALHPAHVESVAFISGRTDLMMALFLLLALLSLVRTRNLPASATLYALALLCKEAAILFPVLAFLYLARGARRPVWRFGFALVAVAAIYLIGRGLILHGPGPTWGDVSLTQRVFLVLNAIGRYAVTALVPFRHQLSYPDLAGFAAPGWPTLAGVVALAASLYVAWRKRGSAVGLGSGLFILTILPAGNFFPPGPSYLSERLLYLPSAGAVLVVVALAARASGWRSRAAAAVGLLACLAMAVNARQRLPVWADELSLCRTMVRERPD
ncbi:hypothetical protein FJY69_11080, partial [candidate division WOR-3 bacterium]|nr:hypothetical protein [candidate division WOR-3 bacterium]